MKEKLPSRWLIATLKNLMRKSYLMTFVLALAFTFAEAGAQSTISGTVTEEDGQPMTGVTVAVQGTTIGTITDADGNYTIENVPGDGVIQFSFVGMKTLTVLAGNQTTINVTMELDTYGLEEVVAVGYGTKKKVNLTGAVSVVGQEELESRPVANVQQALQGVVPNLYITTSNSTGEPGGDMAMNIRGLTSLEGNNNPFVLVDNVPMEINDIDPNDIESISVLKDVASTAIYGARAAYGVILITTKSGKGKTGMNVSYSNSFAMTTLLNMPQQANALDFAYTMNESALNAGSNVYFSPEKLGWIEQNLANPGSATEVLPTPNGLRWDLGVEGLNASAATDWNDVIFKDFGTRMKHNLNVTGGNDRVNYYISGGFFDEQGLLKQGNDSFNRYNIDTKVTAKATDWLSISLLAKYKQAEEDFPTVGWLGGDAGRSFTMILTTRLKPTKPKYYPGTEIWTGRIAEQQVHRTNKLKRQMVISPRITFEPIKGWVTNFELNYRTNDELEVTTLPRTPGARPDGSGGSIVTWGSMEGTSVRPRLFTDKYISPNIYSTYSVSFGQNNFTVLAGYQQESFEYYNMWANARHLLTESIPSISTAVGEKTIDDQIGHWATQGVFGRFTYDFAEKYLLEFNARMDGSSRFEPEKRIGVFPSVSAGWVLSKEVFYPLQDAIEFMKIRGSYGAIGNQNVDNYLYVPAMGISQSWWLFDKQREWQVGMPNISSVNLTWEQVNTLDIGLDIATLNNRLTATFDWYQSKTTNLVGPGEAVPDLLGTGVPKQNDGEVTTTGWELELSWRNRVNNFAYGIRGVVSDYTSKVTKYNNPLKILTTYYEGQTLGEIWGMETDGLFQSVEEVDNHPVDQSYLYSGTWYPGDLKYIDQDGDNVLGIGDNTVDNPGDKKVIGNSTPRYQFGVNLNASWKGFDISMLVQGIAKRDLDVRALGTFRGPANGKLHSTVYEEHLDYWRDDSSPLGANPDAYFPRPYSQYIGQNGKAYSFVTTDYLQNGAFLRIKNMQIGYTVPKSFTQKLAISSARIYLSGENIATLTNLMIYDPEAFSGRYGRIGDQYPLSRVFSLGLNVNF